MNFIGDNSGSTDAFPAGSPNGDGNLVGDFSSPLDPLLMPLDDYGGPTATMLPTSTSLLVDPAGGDTTTTLSTDQRGLSRLEGDFLDIGSVEFNNDDLSDEEVAAAAAAAAARAAQQAAALRAFLHARYSKKVKKFKKKFKAAKRKGKKAKAKRLKRKFKKFKNKRRRL